MEPQVPLPQPEQLQVQPSLFRRKEILIGGSVIIVLLILLGVTTWLAHTTATTRTTLVASNVKPTQAAQGVPVSTAAAPQIIVVSDTPNITLAKVDTSIVNAAAADS